MKRGLSSVFSVPAKTITDISKDYLCHCLTLFPGICKHTSSALMRRCLPR
uniref:SWIM-type domain-containing protein n=1 Tax=Parascaris univalens TaxID=6257 RepID=A0A915A1X7_PARUN